MGSSFGRSTAWNIYPSLGYRVQRTSSLNVCELADRFPVSLIWPKHTAVYKGTGEGGLRSRRRRACAARIRRRADDEARRPVPHFLRRARCEDGKRRRPEYQVWTPTTATTRSFLIPRHGSRRPLQPWRRPCRRRWRGRRAHARCTAITTQYGLSEEAPSVHDRR